MGVEEEEETGVEAGGVDGVEDVDKDVDVDVAMAVDDQTHIRVHQWFIILNSVIHIISEVQ